MDHCVYCGAQFPPELKQGMPEPESLKWVDRPAIPSDAAKQLEVMKILPLEGKNQPRSIAAILTVLAVPVFGVVFYLLYSLLERYSGTGAMLVLLGGAGFIGYLVWSAFRSPRS